MQTSTVVIEDQQVVEEEPGRVSATEGKDIHNNETHRNPEIPVTTQDSGEPGPFHGRKLPRPHGKRISKTNMKQVAHIKQTGPDDLEAKKMESKCEKVGEVGMGGRHGR